MTADAARAQYGPPTTSTCLDCLHAPPPHRLPETGYAVGWPLVLGVVLVALGLLVRGAAAGAGAASDGGQGAAAAPGD